MIQIQFKNLERSELAREIVTEKIVGLFEKFADIRKSRVVVTLEMENSQFQAGPDFFNVKIRVVTGKFRGVIVSKSDSSLYKALAEVSENLLEKLSRVSDKERSRERASARKLSKPLSA